MTLSTYKRTLRGLKKGDVFYLNIINASPEVISYTRFLIKQGSIAPDKEEMDKVIKKQYQYKFYTGDAIAPQMYYRIK